MCDALWPLRKDEVDELRRLSDDVPRLCPPRVLLFEKKVREAVGEYPCAGGLLRPLQRRAERRWSRLGDGREVLPHPVLDQGSSVTFCAPFTDRVAPDGRVPAMRTPRNAAVLGHLLRLLERDALFQRGSRMLSCVLVQRRGMCAPISVLGVSCHHTRGIPLRSRL